MASNQPGDVYARLSALEREQARIRDQVATIATDAAASRVLAAGADRDVSEVRAELRAHTQALNALRETQLILDRKVSDGFATMHVGMQQIHALLSQIAPGAMVPAHEVPTARLLRFLPPRPRLTTLASILTT